jgi:broad specificity phosphatase PhoE
MTKPLRQSQQRYRARPEQWLRINKEQPMAERTIVHLVRHGEVDNPTGILYERLPGFHLTSRGREMAEGLAVSLQGRDIVHLRVSPLERAQETMAPIASTLGLEPVIDARVIESGNKFAGQRMSGPDAPFKKPKNWPLLLNPLKPSWGEPYQFIAGRMMKAIYDAHDAALGHEALIVSHQLPIWIARLQAQHKKFAHSPRSRMCTLCSVTSLHLVHGAIERVTYHEPVRHLLPSHGANDPFSAGQESPEVKDES